MKKHLKKCCMAVLFFPYANCSSVTPYTCDIGWNLDENLRCYRYFPSAVNWKHARYDCQNYYADLVSIHSDSEQYELFVFLWNWGSTTDFWLGGYFDVTWRWSDLTTLEYFHNNPDWETWNTEQYPRECLIMQEGNGTWINRHCTMRFPYVCVKMAKLIDDVTSTTISSTTISSTTIVDVEEIVEDIHKVSWWEITLYVLIAVLFLALILFLALLFGGVKQSGWCRNNKTVPVDW